MNQTAITYRSSHVRYINGKELKAILEDVADNLFNKDPYYRQGGDMVRVGGMSFHCDPHEDFGRRISQLRLTDGKPIVAGKRYKVSGWASVGDISEGKPIDEVVVQYLKAHVNG